MADKTHLKILREGSYSWNQHRKSFPAEEADLSGADLSEVNLNNVNLAGANLSGAVLSGVILMFTRLSGANLSEAVLTGAILPYVDLSEAVLTGAKLDEADLRRARLDGADLRWARLSGANLIEASLVGANLANTDLTKADLNGADLTRADLTNAECEQADFSRADLMLTRLIGTNLNGATLTGARLWETQRAGWSIEEVICESLFWDEEGKKINRFAPGEFERLYAEKVKVVIRYPDGISPLEIVTLPALIQHLEASRLGCKLRFESIQDGPGGTVVTIIVKDAEDASPEQMEQLRASIQAEAEQKAHQLRKALESKEQSVLILERDVRRLEQTLELIVDKFSSRPTYYLKEGDVNMGDKNIVGQGVAGRNAHVHHTTFQQIGGNIESRMDLSALASELATLREAMGGEAKETSQYIALAEVAKAEEAAKAKDSSKVAESLKGAGKWALDVATKIGTSLATEAIKESMGMK